MKADAQYSLSKIARARSLLRETVFHTPLANSPHLGHLVGSEIRLKLENLQRTGSFKIRGAFHKLLRLARANPGAKVTAASAGNHAQGVALSASILGLSAVIFMPEGASLSKRQATAASGADVRIQGSDIEESLGRAKTLAEEPGYTLIHPYDDPDIILGQAGLGLEIMEDWPEVEAVVVPVGGGGLISGVAAAVKQTSPGVMVVGVEPERAASLCASMAAGRPEAVRTRATLADGARVARTGAHNLPLIRRYVDKVVAVEEDSIARAMLLLLERRRVVAEGAGALGLAALLQGLLPELAGKRVALVISGGNVDSNLLGRIIDRGLVRSGRIYRFSAILPDRPGALAGMLELLASTRANVLHISHDRLGMDLPPDLSRVGLELETRGCEHIREIAGLLGEKGYHIREK